MSVDTKTGGRVGVGFALLSIRVASALAFLFHGSQILFGAFHGPGPAAFAAMTHRPFVVGYLVGLAEFCGGLAMLTGVLARLGALCIITVMAGAIVTVHWPHYNLAHNGMEYALTQLLIALAILVTGAGPISLVTLFRAVAGRPARAPRPAQSTPAYPESGAARM